MLEGCPRRWTSNKLFFLLYFGAVQKVWWRSFVSKISRIFCAPQLLNLVFFILSKKWKRYRRCHTVHMYFVSLYASDLSYLLVVLCRSSRQILTTPPIATNFFVAGGTARWVTFGLCRASSFKCKRRSVYTMWNDVTESAVTKRSPFRGYIVT